MEICSKYKSKNHLTLPRVYFIGEDKHGKKVDNLWRSFYKIVFCTLKVLDYNLINNYILEFEGRFKKPVGPMQCIYAKCSFGLTLVILGVATGSELRRKAEFMLQRAALHAEKATSQRGKEA